jgi:opacity protein-like surface antigen
MSRKVFPLLLALAALGVPAAPARADGFLDAWHPNQTYWAIGWEVAIPTNSLRADWVNMTSFAGGQLEVRVGVMERLSVGIATSFNWFEQNFSQVTTVYPEYTVTGPVYRRLGAFTARGTVHYYLTSTRLQPFVGVGVGGIWTQTRIQTADRVQNAYSSYLAVDPEAGFLLSTSQSFAFYLLGRYQWTTASFYQVKDAQWVGVQIGMAWIF